MIEQATCPHGRKIDDRPTALKNMTKCHCCGMKIAPAYRTLCAQCEDTETMTDTKITITPEEAAALWERFCEDREAAFRPHRHDNDRTAIKHALTLAIARERERCAGIAEDYIKENGDWSGMAGEISLDIAAKIRGEE